MPHFRAVFFDLGGTLFAYESARGYLEELLESMARRRGLRRSRPELLRLYQRAVRGALARHVERPFYLHRELFAEAHASFLRALGAEPGPGDADVREAARQALGEAHVAARSEAPEALAALRARGLHLAVVSNIDRDQFERLWPRVGLAAHFDSIVTSEEARSCKPHPEIFRLALERAGTPDPSRVVFVGDSVEHDVVGANALGMTSVLIGDARSAAPGLRSPDHVISDLRELLHIVDGGRQRQAG